VMQLPTPFACPTIPIAAFRGPDAPPQLVTVPTAIFEDPATASARTVAATVRAYYSPIALFGNIEVWQLTGDIPASSYDVVCTADASENSP
jgi:hypothetical protein